MYVRTCVCTYMHHMLVHEPASPGTTTLADLGKMDKVLEEYDNVLAQSAVGDNAFGLVDASSLLWRLEVSCLWSLMYVRICLYYRPQEPRSMYVRTVCMYFLPHLASVVLSSYVILSVRFGVPHVCMVCGWLALFSLLSCPGVILGRSGGKQWRKGWQRRPVSVDQPSLTCMSCWAFAMARLHSVWQGWPWQRTL